MNEKINILKGLALIMMVIDHSGFYESMVFFNHLLVIPIFFFASGYCFKAKYLNAPKQFILKRIKALYLPFLKYALAFILLHNLLCMLHIYDPSVSTHGKVNIPYDITGFAIAIAKAFCFVPTEAILGASWFLPQFFITALLTLFMKLSIKKNTYCFIVSLAFAVICLILPSFPGRMIVSRTFITAAFYFTGCLWKAKEFNITWYYSLTVLVGVFIAAQFFTSEISQLTIITLWPYFILSCIAIIAIWNLLHFLGAATKRVIITLNEYAIWIMMWHMVGFALLNILFVKIYNLPIETRASFPVIFPTQVGLSNMLLWPYYIIVGIAFPIIVAKFYSFINKRKK